MVSLIILNLEQDAEPYRILMRLPWYLIFAEFFRWLVAGPWLVTPRRKSGYDGAACSPALGLVAQVERQQCIAALTVIDKKCLDMRHKFNCGTYPADSKGEKFAATHHYAGKNNIGADDC